VGSSEKYASSEALSDSRRSSAESQSTHLPPSDSGFKSRDEFRKSYSASDSSIDDENNDGMIRTSSGHHRRRRSRKSKIHRQKRSLTNDDDVIIQNNNNNNNSNNNQLSAGQDFSEPHLRHISSDAMIYTRNGFGTRKSSESSDVSDLRFESVLN